MGTRAALLAAAASQYQGNPEAFDVLITGDTDIQTVINANPAGTVYKLTGTFNGRTFVPKTGDTFFGDGTAVLNGGAGSPDFCAIYGGESPASAPDNVTIDNIEIKDYTVPIYGSGSVRHQGAIHGYTVDGSNDPVECCDNWTITRCTITGNEGWGISPGSNWLIGGSVANANTINYNGSCGIGGGGFGGVSGGSGRGAGWTYGTEISYNTIKWNNHPTLSPATGDKIWPGGAKRDGHWDAAGIKIAKADVWTIEHNNVSNNYGAGIWCDIDCYDIGINYNTVDDNIADLSGTTSAIGIYYEICENGTITYNTVTGHDVAGAGWLWPAGIYVDASKNVVVRNNTVEDCKNLIVGKGRLRTDTELQANRRLEQFVVYNNVLKTNGNTCRIGVSTDDSTDFRTGYGNEFKGPVGEDNDVDTKANLADPWWGINHPPSTVTLFYWENNLGFTITEI